MSEPLKPQAEGATEVPAVDAVEPAVETHDPEVSAEAVAQAVDADLVQVDAEPEPVVQVVEETPVVDTRIHDIDYVEDVETDSLTVAADTVAEPALSIAEADVDAVAAEPVVETATLAEAVEPVDYASAPSPALDPVIESGSLEPAISLPLSEPETAPAEAVESFETPAEPAVAEPIAAEATPVETVSPEPVSSEEETPAAETPANETPAVDPVAAAGVAAVAAAAASSSSTSGRKPIWSDQGDAPFNDGPETPIYDRRARQKDGDSAGNETVEVIKTIVFALLIAFVLRVLLFQPFTIPSASMEPNLYEGDYIVVSKWSYGYSRYSIPFAPPLFDGRVFAQTPKRGDIVVFKLPRDNKTDYIKRLIGLPGDRIQMVSNRLYINGQPVDDLVVSQSQIDDVFGPRPVTQVRETLPGGKQIMIQDFGPGNELDDTPVYEVPQGYYFMMGDNRDNSIDSRVEQSAGVGLVPAENLVGKAQIILFSWEPGASLWNPVSWFANLRPSRFFTILH